MDDFTSLACGGSIAKLQRGNNGAKETSINQEIDKRESPIFCRSFVYNKKTTGKANNPSNMFSLLTYNILADCHAQRDYNKAGSWISEQELSMKSRHRVLMEEFKALDADVICLQEVGSDYFKEVLKLSLKDIGYDGIYVARISEEYREGEATFYKFSKFKLLTSEKLLLQDVLAEEFKNVRSTTCEGLRRSTSSYAVSLLTRLKSIESGFVVTVANVHIAYDKFERQDKQCLQIAATVRKLQQMCKEGEGQIICGDFNSWPSSPPQQLLNDGTLNEENLGLLRNILSVDDGNKLTSLVDHIPELFCFNPTPNYQSAYNVVMGSDPYTSRFNTDGSVKQVDFIYFSSVLDVLKVLKVPDQSLIVGGVPNTNFPSDHLSLMVAFLFK